MKIYNVFVDKYDYDTFDSVVVVAENEDKALALVNGGFFGESYFKESQGEIHVEEVDSSFEHVVLASFNAG